MIAPVQASGVRQPAAAPVPKDVARDFEALFITQLLKSARAAQLADDPLAGDTAFRDAQDRELARSLAAAAPLGVARTLK